MGAHGRARPVGRLGYSVNAPIQALEGEKSGVNALEMVASRMRKPPRGSFGNSSVSASFRSDP
jgi:hypothetical protein